MIAAVIWFFSGGVTFLAMFVGLLIVTVGLFYLGARAVEFAADRVLDRYRIAVLVTRAWLRIVGSKRLRHTARNGRPACQACWFEEDHPHTSNERVVHEDIHTCEIGEKTDKIDPDLVRRVRAEFDRLHIEIEEEEAISADEMTPVNDCPPLPLEIVDTAPISQRQIRYPTLIGVTMPNPANDVGAIPKNLIKRN